MNPFFRALLVGAAVTAVAATAWLLFLRAPAPAPTIAPEFDPAAFVRSRPELDAPYVVTDFEVVDAMLALAEVRPGDQVVDLGSGDGRILIAAARSHGASGLGVDIDPERIREAEANARAARVSDRVTFRRQDLFETDLTEADVVTLYLTEEVNERLRPRLLGQMRPGARVVSHDFGMGDWRPDARQRVGTANVYLWIIPARVSGRWRLEAEGRSAVLQISQQANVLLGSAASAAGSRRLEQGRVAGTNVRFITDIGEGRREFLGRVEEGRMVSAPGQPPWRAERLD